MKILKYRPKKANVVTRKKNPVASFFTAHLTRMATVLSFALLSNYVVYVIIGIFNRLLGRPIVGTLTVYPGDRRYADAFTYGWFRKLIGVVSTFFISVSKQNGKLILNFAMRIEPWMLHDRSYRKHIKKYLRYNKRRAWLLGVGQATTSGELPGIAYRLGFYRPIYGEDYVPPEALNTSCAIAKGLKELEKEKFPGFKVLLLGGRGFVGKHLRARLKGFEICCLDKGKEDFNEKEFPFHWQRERVVVVNLLADSSLKHYAPHLRGEEWVFINEAYPMPKRDGIGLPQLHVSGVVAKSIPAFPYPYIGVIPCCGCWPSPDLELAFLPLNQEADDLFGQPGKVVKKSPGTIKEVPAIKPASAALCKVEAA